MKEKIDSPVLGLQASLKRITIRQAQTGLQTSGPMPKLEQDIRSDDGVIYYIGTTERSYDSPRRGQHVLVCYSRAKWSGRGRLERKRRTGG